jgi:hypothetical protein
MQNSRPATARALVRFALVVAASAAAATLWAQNRPVEGYMLDARAWREEVSVPQPVPWPADGWWRLAPQDRAIEVRAVKPGDGGIVPADAFYLRLPGAALKPGARRAYPYMQVLHRPSLGADYELALGATRFSLRVENVVKGMQYTIGYGGQSYTYVLGPFDAQDTGVRAVADLDGDAQPDFLVDVHQATYLLLSSQARPGMNLPTAELWSSGG